MEGKGVFVKEIEDALLGGEIDLAVHSMKDLPTEVPAGLTVPVLVEREDPRDALVSLNHESLKDLSPGATIGTGSLRRQAQVLHVRSDVSVVPIRGNIDTRLKKLARGEMNALILAAAGLRRIGREEQITEYLSPDICLNAVAQGALGLETRWGEPVIESLAFLHHVPTALAVSAERAFLKCLGGGCQVPVGARGYVSGREIRLTGVVADPGGKKLFRGEVSGRVEEAEKLGEQLALQLLQEGAGEILSSIRGPSAKEARVAAPGPQRAARSTNHRPLSGRRILITRPRAQAGSFVREIESLGGEVLEFPTIEILPPKSYDLLDKAIREIESYHWIVFTSVNGVRYFFLRFQHLEHDIGQPKDIRIAAIGPETAKALAAYKLKVELLPMEYRAEGILQDLGPEEVRGRRFLLPRAAEARDILPKTLRKWGAEVDVVQTYRTVSVKGDPQWLREVLSEKKVDMVTFTSSSTARHFAALFPGEKIKDLLDRVAVGCIGPITKETAQEKGIRVDVVADEYTVPGLVRAIVGYFDRQ
jgi:hydroxymethylbilane synthase